METKEEKAYYCVGCGRSIPWDGRGLFSYTCSCGARIFATEDGAPALPASLVLAVHENREIPHIDYYLGYSNYLSAEKQLIYEELKRLGAIWSWECPQCRDRYIKRKRLQMQEGLLPVELHPQLKKLMLEG